MELHDGLKQESYSILKDLLEDKRCPKQKQDNAGKTPLGSRREGLHGQEFGLD